MISPKEYIGRITAGIVAFVILVLVLCLPECRVNAKYASEERIADFLGKLEIGAYSGKGVTRVDFASMIMKAVDAYENNNVVEESVFLDVEGIPVSFVNPAVSMGYFKVPDDRKFRPYDYVTYEEAVAVCVRVLGYENMAVQKGVMAEYIVFAQRLDILSGVSASDFHADSVNRLVYNMLHGMCAKKTYTASDLSHIEIGTVSLLEEIYGIRFLSGSVTSINGLARVGTDAVNAQKIMIDGNSYVTLDTYDTEKFLGIYVDYYVTEMNGREILFAMYACTEQTSIRLYGSDIVKAAEDVSSLTYYNGKSSKTAKLAKDITVIYNNENRFAVTANDFLGEDVTVILTDADKDGVYDHAMIKKPEYHKVLTVNADYMRLDFEDGSNPLLLGEISDEDQLMIVSQNGSKAELADIKNGSYIEVLLSKTASGEIDYEKAITITLLENKITGKAEAITSTDNRIVIDGTEYPYISDISDEIQLGEIADFYIGTSGTIVAVGENSYDSTMYGYWVAAAKEGGLSGEIKVKLFTQNNQMKQFKTDKKVKFSGYINGVYEDNRAVQAEELLKYVAKPQLVRFYADENDVLKQVHVAYDHSGEPSYEGYDPDRFSLEYHSKNGRFFNVVVNEDYFYDASSVIFSIPEDGKDEDYHADKYSYYAEERNVELMAYDSNDKWAIAAGVMISSDSAAAEPENDVIADEYVVLISKKISVLDEDGMPITAYTGYCRGAEIKLIPYRETLSDKTISVPAQGEKSEIFFNELNPGDVLQCWKNSDGKVRQMNVLHRFDAKNPKPAYYSLEPGSGYLSVCITEFGAVTKSRPDSYFRLESTDKRYNLADLRYPCYIYEFDVNTGRVTVLKSLGFFDDVSSENPDYVFAKTRRTSLRDVVIYRSN